MASVLATLLYIQVVKNIYKRYGLQDITFDLDNISKRYGITKTKYQDMEKCQLSL